MRPGLAAAVATAAAIAAVAVAGSSPARACACGVAIEASVTEESALVIERPGAEEIILSLDLASDGAQRAAVVLPVPGVPEVSAVRGDPLAYLELATTPAPTVGASGGGDDDAAAAPPVEVIDERVIGGYQVARLEAGSAAALDRWLTDNEYTLPPGAEPILGEYVSEGWRFVAIKLAPGAEGRLKPLSVAFATDEVVYPMRMDQLAQGPLDITVFTLADGPRETQYLTQTWTGDVAELEPPPPPRVAPLFADGGVVTRLEASGMDASAFTSDLVIEPAPEVVATEAAVAQPVETDAETGISTGVVVAMILAGIAFAIGLGVATRR